MNEPECSSLPIPPFFQIPNLNNFRDAALYPGGLPTSTPHQRVRPGVLFRSAEVSKLDRDGWRAVREAGVGVVFDLRSKPEVEKGWRGITGGKEGEADEGGVRDVRQGWERFMEEEGIRRVWVPVFEESDYSPERLAERYLRYMGEGSDGFAQAYHDILTHAGPAYRTILDYLISLPPPSSSSKEDQTSPLPLGALIHCTAGKDRTGIFFGILFSFLGVPNDFIAAEYNLTDIGLLPAREAIVPRLIQSDGFKKFILSQISGTSLSSNELADMVAKRGTHFDGDETEGEVQVPPEVLEKARQAAYRMVGARKESMLAALKAVNEEWGSAEGYLRKVCELGDKELEKLELALVTRDQDSSL